MLRHKRHRPFADVRDAIVSTTIRLGDVSERMSNRLFALLVVLVSIVSAVAGFIVIRNLR